MKLNSTICVATNAVGTTNNFMISAPVTINDSTLFADLRYSRGLIDGCVKYDDSGYIMVSPKPFDDVGITDYITAYKENVI